MIDFEEGRLKLSGELVHETFTESFQVTVPENQLFVLGDNRNNSRDSREFGCFDVSRVIGVTLFIVLK